MLVIDVGAHDGSVFSIPYAKDRNNLVYAIEPIPALAEKIRSSGLTNLHVFCAAVGEQEGLATLYINQDSQTSSLLPNEAKGPWLSYADNLKELETLEVSVIRLDNFMRSNCIAEVDLLKVDAQGYDLQVIKSAGDLIRKVKRIQLEVQVTPLYTGSASKEEVVEYLEALDFRLVNTSLQTEGLEQNLEFIRLSRYSNNSNLSISNSSQAWEVNVPYVGMIRTPKNDLVGKLLKDNLFEGPEQAFLWLYLRPGDTFFDCGAHVGLFSCIAANKLNNDGRIIGFEPIDDNISLYCQNLQSLGCQCFISMQVGLSDNSGTAKFLLGKSGLSAYSTFATGAQFHEQISEKAIVVDQLTLDQVVEDYSISEVNLAKLDVEGWEISVLLGAQKSIGKNVFPVWMIEFTEKNAIAAGKTTQELFELLEDFGYTICRFDPTDLILVPEIKRDYYEYQNLFATLDIQSVNDRLIFANSKDKEIARDIISKWDMATNFQEAETTSSFYKQENSKLSLIINKISSTSSDKLELVKVYEAEKASLLKALKQSESDRWVRLQLINAYESEKVRLLEALKQSEADSLVRLQLVSTYESEKVKLLDALKQSEADRLARLELINTYEGDKAKLLEALKQSEIDRLARLELINTYEGDKANLLEMLKKSEKERINCLELINIHEGEKSRSLESFSQSIFTKSKLSKYILKLKNLIHR